MHTGFVPPDAHTKSGFRERLEWIFANRRHDGKRWSFSTLSLRAGLSRSTVGNNIRAAEAAGVEPNFDSDTLKRIAGVARVSFSWLSGLSSDPDAGDIPEPPEPLDDARKKVAKADLKARIADLERQIQELKQLAE